MSRVNVLLVVTACPPPSRARARVRAELTREILAAAHEELAAAGAAGLSLRAVARRLEMVPSALYRYFPSRDALLTALIVDAYEAVGAAAAAGAGRAAARRLDRWLAVARGRARAGPTRHPHEWALRVRVARARLPGPARHGRGRPGGDPGDRATSSRPPSRRRTPAGLAAAGAARRWPRSSSPSKPTCSRAARPKRWRPP